MSVKEHLCFIFNHFHITDLFCNELLNIQTNLDILNEKKAPHVLQILFQKVLNCDGLKVPVLAFKYEFPCEPETLEQVLKCIWQVLQVWYLHSHRKVLFLRLITQAVEVAHKHFILHGDIKPGKGKPPFYYSTCKGCT